MMAKPSAARAVPPSVAPQPAKTRRAFIPRLGSWLLLALVLMFLAGLALPVFNSTCAKGAQTKALAQAKSIGLVLKLYAGDHNGNYPRAGQPEMRGAKPADSNAAFAVLLPDYVTSESIFGNKLSAYQTRIPDNEIDRPYTGHPVKTLAPGENVYAYVTGLNDEDSPTTPLVADGTGCYVTDPARRGGVWSGTKVIVIRLDNSGALETLRGPPEARYVPTDPGAVPEASIRPAQAHENLLKLSDFGSDVRLLDPAVAPGGSR